MPNVFLLADQKLKLNGAAQAKNKYLVYCIVKLQHGISIPSTFNWPTSSLHSTRNAQ